MRPRTLVGGQSRVRALSAMTAIVCIVVASCGDDDSAQQPSAPTASNSVSSQPITSATDRGTPSSVGRVTTEPTATTEPAEASRGSTADAADPLAVPVEQRVQQAFEGIDVEQPEVSTLRVPTVGTSTLNVGLWVAEHLGIFDRFGLDITWEVANPGVQTSAFIAGEYDILNSTGTIGVNLLTAGVDIDIYSFPQPYQFFQVVAQPEYPTLEDLADARIGISAAGSVTQQTVETCFDRAGLDTANVDFAILEATANMLPALEAESVDAVAFSEPRVYQAEQAGYVSVCDLSGEGLLGTTGPVIVRRSFADENPITVKNYLLAMAMGFHIALTDRAAGEAAISAQGIDMSDPGVADAVYTEIWAAAASPERSMDYPDDLLRLLKEQDSDPERIELELAMSARPDTAMYEQVKDPAYFEHLYDTLGPFPDDSQAARDWASR